jgi:hypothetical protein
MPTINHIKGRRGISKRMGRDILAEVSILHRDAGKTGKYNFHLNESKRKDGLE